MRAQATATDGYRRITAVVNRALSAEHKTVVNTKHVLRIMQANGLTLERHTALPSGRTHDGAVIALRSNVRWCSDHLELHCRDGTIACVLFAIDLRAAR
jgi:putative transposase